MGSLCYSESMEHPTVEAYFTQFCDQTWQKFYLDFKEQFEEAPAAESKHHNFTGGLAMHTAEVIRAMFEIRDKLSSTSLQVPSEGFRTPEIKFEDADIVISAYMHDFAKIVQYQKDESGDWRFVKMTMPQETWTLMTLAQHGIPVTEDQTLAMLFAEGGFSDFHEHGTPNALSWLLHMADIWSSQILCPTLTVPLCPRCGRDMKKRKGPRGYFWGCTGYPACGMTINIE